ncbi:hypothetical protein F3Y22_tig00116962pilonHSYRG01009 [Hibiscus syriacus]|uniref:Uncharacterized protein n=1 Tax=Hibiscus syriacus TaxID=106335 RepID=A0A6A2WLB0_HIBSY|nr:hypothetical protein F3Y22_tig00116962pilonHSYRG01009 [Hibiscus syriacus]
MEEQNDLVAEAFADHYFYYHLFDKDRPTCALQMITTTTIDSIVGVLGVPLSPRKLSVKDRDSLVEKVKAKLGQWANRFLSYAGRLQLIGVVLFNVANFWCRQHVLPAAVVSRVEQLCARFQWKGKDVPARGARVCTPKAGKECAGTRMVRMGIPVDEVCQNCGCMLETRNRIFFECVFAKEVWRAILRLCNVNREVRDWEGEMIWAVSVLKGSGWATKAEVVALRFGADQSVLNRCKIDAYQDTLNAHSNREFYRDSSVPFIFGKAAVVFQNSKRVARKPMNPKSNMVTASNQNTGTSIQSCNMTASADLEPVKASIKSYLGRAWKEYSRTVVIQSYIE